MSALFYQLPKTLKHIFQLRNLSWFCAGAIVTYVCVATGFDWLWYTRTFSVHGFLFPAAFIGLLLPVIAPLTFLLVGSTKKSLRALNTGWALGQAAVLGVVISSIIKVFTGRPGPTQITAMIDTSHVFRFGFWKGGAFFGWPSSHTTVAFAMALTLVALFPDKKWVRYSAMAYAWYVGISVSASIHWFSDFVAGAILGTLIGMGVGQTFYKRYLQKK